MITGQNIRILLYILIYFVFSGNLLAQKFFPDDPIRKDEDNLNIEQPAFMEISPTYDMVENTFGPKVQPISRAQGINTLGEVPDSSWFTNRIGIQEMQIEELIKGGDSTGGPDLSGTLTVTGSSLTALTPGLTVRDSRGDSYYLIF